MSSGDLMQKLENLKKGLVKWAGQIQMNRQKKMKALTAKLLDLYDTDRDENNLAELIDTKIQLNFEIEKDERHWEQKARLNWLKFEDKNTAFFHSQVTQRKKKNCIRKLQTENGRETETLQKIEGIACSYFQQLFSTEQRGPYDHFLSGIGRCIYEEDNK
ncbi:hypothetical protein PVK06_038122 [Gossypium arboreum]|uniref:Reverse transcriptase n=1 Tax=Gossypium arboreum TaxID=29729 RepID=A0ABR0MZU3_GOSAR|nr:hypothetical protein PVK06_038122 [Gossypium arboreum]